MSQQLRTTGTDTTYNTEKYREDQLLHKYIYDNWNATDPAKTEIAWGYTLQQMGSGERGPDGTGLTITLFCYATPGTGFTNLKGIGWAYEFDTKVRVDVGLRSERDASGTGIAANKPDKLTKLDRYLRNLITRQPDGMKAYGIQEIKLWGMPEFFVDDSDKNIYHYVATVDMHYLMHVN